MSKLSALKAKRDETFKIVQKHQNQLKRAKRIITFIESKIRKSSKRYELLDRKIFELEREIEMTKERKEIKKQHKKQTKKQKQIDQLLNNLTSAQLQELLDKHTN